MEALFEALESITGGTLDYAQIIDLILGIIESIIAKLTAA